MGLSLTGNLGGTVVGKNISLDNCTVSSGTKIQYQDNFEISGTSAINSNCIINQDIYVNSDVSCFDSQ